MVGCFDHVIFCLACFVFEGWMLTVAVVPVLASFQRNRVTLKIDVYHADHSHVIGRGGKNIKQVMTDTVCHIHFPDSNRSCNLLDKSSQVSFPLQPFINPMFLYDEQKACNSIYSIFSFLFHPCSLFPSCMYIPFRALMPNDSVNFYCRFILLIILH